MNRFAWCVAGIVATAVSVAAAEPPKTAYPTREPDGWEKGLRAGGNGASQATVARGLIWLTKQQKENGAWVFDGEEKRDVIGATALALLPYLGARQTHLEDKPVKYNKQVAAAVTFLIEQQHANGNFKIATPRTSQAMVALALCELYGITRDRKLLFGPAQKAISYLVSIQGDDGGWSPEPKQPSSLSTTVWVLQAFHAARECGDIILPKEAFVSASKFLDSRSKAVTKTPFSESFGGDPTHEATAAGLLGRIIADKWDTHETGLGQGVEFMMKTRLPNRETCDFSYFYHSSAVQFFRGKVDWHIWNSGQNGRKGLRDILIDLQIPEGRGEPSGSWDPDSTPFGKATGRVGCTALAILTLEVYYRHAGSATPLN